MSDFPVERFLSAIDAIPADDREIWLYVGMALKHELGDRGFIHFDAWSQSADSYNAQDAISVWRSFRNSGRVTAGTVYHYAKQHGWHDTSPPDPAILERKAQSRERLEAEALMLAKDRAKAVQHAKELWAVASGSYAHPYLRRKQIETSVPTVRSLDADSVAEILGYAPKMGDHVLVGRLLLVPVKIAGQLSTLELIDEGGYKSALRGGAKKGGYWATAPQDTDIIVIAEGMATTLTVSRAISHPGVATLSCGNILPVASYLRARYPATRLLICADIGNGQKHAEHAALAVGAALAVPDFGATRPDGATDFNDLMCLDGIQAVRLQLEGAL